MKLNTVESNLKYIPKVLNSAESCVAYRFHGILSTNLTRGSSITYLDSPLILSSKIEDVVKVVWSEMNKSVQRPTT